MKIGTYRLTDLSDPSVINAIETEYQSKIDIISLYRAWNRCRIEDDSQWLEKLKTSPKEILLTWEPWNIIDNDASADQAEFSIKKIVSGTFDTYIKNFAERLKTFQTKIYLRPMHEMNGDWYPWCGTVNENKPVNFIHAWNHVRDIFLNEGVDNIQWVWSPYTTSYPETVLNSMENYFPGDQSVDWIGLDGYNWGNTQEWSSWQSFDKLFLDAFEGMKKISKKPFMIAETGCAEQGGDKSIWIKNAFNSLTNKYHKVKILTWFDVNKECDWSVSSSDSSLKMFQKNMRCRNEP